MTEWTYLESIQADLVDDSGIRGEDVGSGDIWCVWRVTEGDGDGDSQYLRFEGHYVSCDGYKLTNIVQVFAREKTGTNWERGSHPSTEFWCMVRDNAAQLLALDIFEWLNSSEVNSSLDDSMTVALDKLKLLSLEPVDRCCNTNCSNHQPWAVYQILGTSSNYLKVTGWYSVPFGYGFDQAYYVEPKKGPKIVWCDSE